LKASFASIVVLVLVLWVVFAVYAWRTVKAEQAGQLANLVDLAARSCDVFFRRYAEQLPTLAVDVRTVGGLRNLPAVHKVLARFHSQATELAAVNVLSPDGHVLVSTFTDDRIVAANPMTNPTFRADFERALTIDGVSVGRPFYGVILGEWVMSMRLRESGADGKVRYVLSAALRLADQQALWRGVSLPEGSVIGLLRDDSFLQSRLPLVPDPARVYGERHVSYLTELLERDGYPQAGIAEGVSSIAGNRRLLAFRRLSSQPMTAYLTVPMEVVWTAWRQRVQVPFVLFGLLLSGVTFAGVWSVRSQRQETIRRDLAESILLSREAELHRQTVLLEATQRAASVGGWEIDIASGHLYWSAEMYRIHEIAPADYVPTLDSALDFFAPEARTTIRDAFESTLNDGKAWDIELELITAKGRRIWTRATGAAQMGTRGSPVKASGSLQDISSRRAAEERIRHMAHYDELTGLANRALFTAQLTHALSRAERWGKRLAVLFIDLDRFKNINDSLGHDVGDEVLREIGRRLVGTMRAADLTARLGGDEFVILIEELEHPDRMPELCRKLLRTIEQPIVAAKREFLLSASIGIASYPADGLDAQTLLKHADIAMYRAKEQGKNTFEFFSSQPHVPAIDVLSLEARLRRAVMELRQFVLHYQPQVSVVDGRITGVEALVRWSTPEGLVPPGQFIALAEETGLIGTLGSWVLGSACAQAHGWRKRGLPRLRMAVNLSARQFYGAHLVDEIREVIQVTGIDPQCLELEITESVMMKNIEHVAKQLKSLKDIGVGIAVDDFGTGYSSLAYLKRLPIDSLKIDRSFVRDVPHDHDDAAIARAVIALAHSLRLKVVAEGVETQAQLEFLAALGCDEIQGYLFSHPRVAVDIEDLLRRDVRLGMTPARASA
jgi:diguanylate cyclase (GGDEF)-like protein